MFKNIKRYLTPLLNISLRTMADFVAKPVSKILSVTGLSSTSREYERAVQETTRVLEDGGLVGVPTDTIYGIACLASNSTAVKNIYELKGKLTNFQIFHNFYK